MLSEPIFSSFLGWYSIAPKTPYQTCSSHNSVLLGPEGKLLTAFAPLPRIPTPQLVSPPDTIQQTSGEMVPKIGSCSTFLI